MAEEPTAAQDPASSATAEKSVERIEREISRHETAMLRWTRVVGFFTFVLAMVGGLQALSFVESERAYLILFDMNFPGGEPSNATGGLDIVLTIKNIGKHTATVSKIIVNPAMFIVNKELADEPTYNPTLSTVHTIPPIAPDSPLVFFAAARLPPSPAPMTDEQRLQVILSGDIPLRIWGLIEYDTGYFNWARPGRLGFCMEYVSQVFGRRQQGGSARSTDRRPKTCTAAHG